MSEVEDIARLAGCTPLQVWTLTQILDAGRTESELAAERRVTRSAVQKTRLAAVRRINRVPTNRQQHALDLRKDGHTWDYIAFELKISRQGAYDLHRRGEARARK